MAFERTHLVKLDGRSLWLYGWERPIPTATSLHSPALESDGLQLRWNPLLAEWVIVAPERQDRTFLPSDAQCPLCPTPDGGPATEIPVSDFEIAVFENRFPSLSSLALQPGATSPPYQAERATGAAEVVVYTAEHSASLRALPLEHVNHLVDVWADRYEELSRRADVEYVLIFENRGVEIGVTLTHPHGQIYAFPFVPPVPARALAVAHEYQVEHGTCLSCDVARTELEQGARVIYANNEFAAYVPYAARYPYELHIVSRAHCGSLKDLDAAGRQSLAAALQTVLQKYDSLWSRPMPFVMVVHQRPTGSGHQQEGHLRIELTPPYRSVEKLKYLAGCETGAGVFINDALAEDTAAALRGADPVT